MKLCAQALLAGFLLTAGNLRAQDVLRAPDGGTAFHVDGVELLAVPDKPLTGKSSIEWTRTLDDGSTVTVHLLANLARDSQGRMYREQRSFVPANSRESSRLTAIHLYDPVARTQTICSVEARQCTTKDYSPRKHFVTLPVGPYANGTRTLDRQDLGADVIEGMNVTGTRETTTIEPGVVGNDRPLVSTRDFWYSADLETNLSVTRNDPRNGKQVVRLVGLSVSEPNPHLFAIPEGYQVHDDRVSARADH